MSARTGRGPLLLRLAALVAVIVALTPLAARPGEAQAPFAVVATGLDNPRHLAFGPDGALYVAEAGRGGAGPCLEGPDGDEVCFGASGAVTRITAERQERILTGLPSLASRAGGEATGPQGIAIRGGAVNVLIGLGADPADRAQGGAAFAAFGTHVEAGAGGALRTVVDAAAYEGRANPDRGEVDSNPYALLADGDRWLIADAGGNSLLAIGADGALTTLATFPPQQVPAPPMLNLPPGARIPSESVPTSVTRGPDGAYYVGELTGFPFPVGGARVWRVVPGEEPTVYASGFTTIGDLAFDRGGNLYVLEITANGLLSGDPTGALYRVTPARTRTLVAREGLVFPTGLAVGPYGALYVANYGVIAGQGQVVRILP